MAKSIATYLVGQDESRVNTHRRGFEASELELNRSFNFELRSLVVDVHDTTLPKGSGIVSVAVLIGDGAKAADTPCIIYREVIEVCPQSQHTL